MPGKDSFVSCGCVCYQVNRGQAQFITDNEPTQLVIPTGRPFQNHNGLDRPDALTFLMIYDIVHIVLTGFLPFIIISSVKCWHLILSFQYRSKLSFFFWYLLFF